MSGTLSICGIEALDLLDVGIATIAIRGDGSKAPTREGWQLKPRDAEAIRSEHADADLGLAAVPGLSDGLKDVDIDALERIEPIGALAGPGLDAVRLRWRRATVIPGTHGLHGAGPGAVRRPLQARRN